MGHPINWYAGWSLILAAFATGAVIGLGFARENFMGGYDSWPRRLMRLGHIALAALGMLNMIYGIAPRPFPDTWQAAGAGTCLIIGGIAMPVVCFLSAWKKPFRNLFFIPVIALIVAAICVLLG
jgi:hypothetical protein